MTQQNKKLYIQVQSFQQKFVILCSETVSKNLPVPEICQNYL